MRRAYAGCPLWLDRWKESMFACGIMGCSDQRESMDSSMLYDMYGEQKVHQVFGKALVHHCECSLFENGLMVTFLPII